MTAVAVKSEISEERDVFRLKSIAAHRGVSLHERTGGSPVGLSMCSVSRKPLDRQASAHEPLLGRPWGLAPTKRMPKQISLGVPESADWHKSGHIIAWG